jgi:hypothetical protein
MKFMSINLCQINLYLTGFYGVRKQYIDFQYGTKFAEKTVSFVYMKHERLQVVEGTSCARDLGSGSGLKTQDKAKTNHRQQRHIDKRQDRTLTFCCCSCRHFCPSFGATSALGSNSGVGERGRVRQDKTRQDKTRYGGLGKTRQDKTMKSKTRQENTSTKTRQKKENKTPKDKVEVSFNIQIWMKYFLFFVFTSLLQPTHCN